jgi:hypothetical protein
MTGWTKLFVNCTACSLQPFDNGGIGAADGRLMKLPWTILVACVLLTAGGVNSAYADPQEPSVKESLGTAVLRASYVSTFLVQAMDASSTQQVVAMGGREMNPLLMAFAGNSGAMYGVKAGMAAAFVMSEHSVARHHKFAAIAVAAVINSAYLITAQHNLRIVRQMRSQQAAAR